MIKKSNTSLLVRQQSISMAVTRKANVILVLCLMIGPSMSVNIHDECEARPEWEFDYKGTEIDLSVWVPPGESSEVLTLEIEFEGYSSPMTFDKIILSREEVQFDRMRSGKSTTKDSLPEIIPEGWIDITILIATHYEIVYHGSNMVSLFNKSVEFIPRSVKVIGSNVTTDCRSELRTWRIDDTPIYLPLDGSKEHFFSFFSTKEFLPSIDIEMRHLLIGTDNGSLTTVHSKAKPLPAFEHHQVTFSCYHKNTGYHCGLKIGANRTLAEEIPVGSKPNSLLLKSKQGGHFFVFLYDQDPLSLTTGTTTDSSPTLRKQNSGYGSTVIAMAALLVLETAGILGLIIVVFKLHRNSHGGKLNKKRQMLMRSGSSFKRTKHDQRISAEIGVESGDEGVEETNTNGKMMNSTKYKNEVTVDYAFKDSGILSDDDQPVDEEHICS